MILPNVLVIMPAYNAQLFISEAINSILSQKGVNIDLHIIDDFSTDSTYKIIKSYPNVTIYRNNKNMGNYYSVNLVLHKLLSSNKTWEYHTFHAADDVSHPNRFIKQINRFKKNILAVGCGFQRVNFNTKQIISKSEKTNESMLIFRRDVLNIIGYRDCGRFGCDTEYKKRLMLARPNSIINMNQILLSAYSHNSNITKRVPLGSPDRKKYVSDFTKKHVKMKKEKSFYQDFKP
jgi:glycosyltransferase involved in cell wall biosynthesis